MATIASIHPDASQTSTDLMQPQTKRTRSIAQNIIEKDTQAEIVVVDLGIGESSAIEVNAAQSMAESVITGNLQPKRITCDLIARELTVEDGVKVRSLPSKKQRC